MKRTVHHLYGLMLGLGLSAGAWSALAVPAAPAHSGPMDSPALRQFESKVRPLLLAKCQTCHGARLRQGGLRLDSRDALLRGGASGAALVPGKPEASLLLRRIRHADASLRMPPGDRLSDADVANLIAWIKAGAPWPSAGVGGQESGVREGEGKGHWAFQPVRRPAIPAVRNRAWVKTPVDAFVLAGLEAKGLKPSPSAGRRTLIRRVTFDLTGLPPTPAEIAQFERECDQERGKGPGARGQGKAKSPRTGTSTLTPNSQPPSPRAYARLIDRLLSSPRYGEKWGRHWLDCVRYADSNGLDENYHYANAWRYRDYVIDAFNRDLPYDQFLREQLAGDLLPPASDAAENYRRVVGTGFYMLGPKLLANPDKVQVLADIIDEQIDVTSRAMLGVTLACARCHDHKFDPFSQKDYYALAGIFRSTRSMVSLKDRIWSERPLATEEAAERFEAHQRALENKKKELETAKSKGNAVRVTALEAEVRSLEKTAPPTVPYALAVQDGEVMDIPLFIRGDHNNPGEVVRRGFPSVLVHGAQPQLDSAHSGRLELAQWISDSQNPLTARVMVNRAWQWHFGDGLVRTSDNFGALGEKPSNPALLDWLSSEFTASGWKLKQLHRLLMLSNTYQMSSAYEERAHTADPDNRLLWRMSRRHLDAEEQRDAMLAVTGELDTTMGGSLLDVPNKVRVTTDGSDDLAAKSYDGHRRSIYLPVIRNSLYEMLELFDFADASAVTTRRSETIASPQALFLMNHPFMLQRAERLGARLLENARLDDAGRIREACLRTFGRPPTSGEVRMMTAYLRDYARELAPTLADPSTRRQKAWQSLCQTLLCANEFLYVD